MALRGGAADGSNLLVCAPTSSGKTLIAEIVVVQSIRNQKRALYLVSHKALAEQKYEDFLTKFSAPGTVVPGSVGLSTGDREEGELQADVLISTYEKALALILSEQIDVATCTVVADEFQILADDTRGPNIELLCTILKIRGTSQFVALTATVENADDPAGWMDCNLMRSTKREVPLDQEIWFDGRRYAITFGQDEGTECEDAPPLPGDLVPAVKRLVDKGFGPILVFVETRREASGYAADFAKNRQVARSGISLSEQLDLFTEPSERSVSLRQSTERRVAFHSADLTPPERQIIEQGFLENEFDVCFATSTLAAGVNFPFRTVVFPKLTYQYGDRKNDFITRSDYTNMSGRAGRLQIHERGLCILLPQTKAELRHANDLVLPTNDNVYSRFAELSMRQAVLTLVAAGLGDTETNLFAFFENTYYWYLTLDRNPSKLDIVRNDGQRALTWLVEAELIDQQDDLYLPTPLGLATARSGLLPQTAIDFKQLLTTHYSDLNNEFDNCIPGIVHWVCSADEFLGEAPIRFLPYPIGGVTPGTQGFLSGNRFFRGFDRTNSRLNQNVHALLQYLSGMGERQINHHTHITSGNLHRLALDVNWILDGINVLAAVPDLGCPQSLGNKIAVLSRRIRWGAPANAIDLIRLSNRARVPGLGRQRAMKLVNEDIVDFDDVAEAGLTKLTELLGSATRAEALLTAVSDFSEVSAERLIAIHHRLGEKIGLSKEINECLTHNGTEYESAIVKFLKKIEGWKVTVIDDGIRQNVPDILVECENRSVLIEMKTSTSRMGLVKKEDAFAVIQKAMMFDKEMKRATLGKPGFDEVSKENAASSVEEVTLVEHAVFMEAALRVLVGEITPNDFLTWITESGLAEFVRIPGRRTDLLL